MSHFDIVKELNDVRLDSSRSRPVSRSQSTSSMRLQMQRPRRQSEERCAGASPLKSKFHTPGKASGTPSRGASAKTPGGDVGNRSTKKSKTPGAEGARSAKKAKTPSHGGADRFIPNRANMDLDFAHYALMNGSKDMRQDDGGENNDPEYSGQLASALNCDRVKILNFKQKAPEVARSDGSNLRVLYNTGKCVSKASTSNRHIPSKPDRILDAPDLVDDYYLNLLDWSHQNIMTVALGPAVYLWNAETATIEHLLEISNPGDYVTSVSWLQEGAVLAVALSTGAVQLWDTDQQKMLRSMTGHSTRVGCLSWNKHILSSGSKSGAIHHHDVRVAQHQVATLQNHTQEVCGLKWSPNGRYLASGGNDNLVNIWSNQVGAASANVPVHTFTQHRAAVKAIAWCPWKPYLLATGGGSADRQILMWNVQSGANVGTTATDSQVCALLWSKEHKELISGHGYATNHLRIWNYPTMSKVTDLVGHTARILSMTMSPDGTTVASAAGDETIRLWKCFEVDKTTKKSTSSISAKSTDKMLPSLARKCIR